MSETTTAREFAPLSQLVKWSEFRSAVQFVAAITDRTRGALPMASAVLVEVSGNTVHLVATDRYRLHVVELPAGDGAIEGRYLLPAGELLAAVKSARVIGFDLALSADGWALTVGGTTTAGHYVPAEFPNQWATLFPTTFEAVERVGVSADLLAGSLSAIAKAYGSPCVLTFNGSARGFLIDGFAPNARALVMPRRLA